LMGDQRVGPTVTIYNNCIARIYGQVASIFIFVPTVPRDMNVALHPGCYSFRDLYVASPPSALKHAE